MLNLGDFTTSDTIYVPFATYDSNGASVTITGLAVTDIEIYKDGSVTQRSSDSGYSLLDTDGIDFDGVTGIHGFSIDLSDNTDSGFYAAGSQYWLVVTAITVDSQTVNFVYYFSIGRYLKPATAGRTLAVNASGLASVDVINWDSIDLSSTAILPTVAAGANGGLPTVDGSNRIAGIQGTITTLDALDTAQDSQHSTTQGTVSSISSAIGSPVDLGSGSTIAENLSDMADNNSATFNASTDCLQAIRDRGDAAWITATSVTVSDKTGFSLSAAGIDAIWDEATAGHVTAGTYGVAVTDILTDTAEIGAAGAGLTEAGGDGDHLSAIPKTGFKLASDGLDLVTAWTVDITGTISTVTTCTDLTVTAHAEPTGVPAANEAIADKIGYLFMALRNQIDVTATKKTFYDDGGTAEWEKDLSDDGTTYSESEGNAI